jgi:hypothetical protein
MAGAKPMSSNGEQVANDVVDREESLGVCHRFEAPHVACQLLIFEKVGSPHWTISATG